MTDELSWTPPDGGKITFPPGTTPEQVADFIREYKRSKSPARIDKIK